MKPAHYNRYQQNPKDHLKDYLEKNLHSKNTRRYEFIDTGTLPKLNQEDIINLDRSITSNETEAVRVSQ